MTNEERMKIVELQQRGYGYKKIATNTGLSVNTVKSFCKNHSTTAVKDDCCLQCGRPLQQIPHKRKKKYCSDSCRNAWWSAHPEMRAHGYGHVCGYCKRPFVSMHSDSKYCSRLCYSQAKQKGAAL